MNGTPHKPLALNGVSVTSSPMLRDSRCLYEAKEIKLQHNTAIAIPSSHWYWLFTPCLLQCVSILLLLHRNVSVVSKHLGALLYVSLILLPITATCLELGYKTQFLCNER